MTSSNKIRLSLAVRELVEFSLRNGDLDYGTLSPNSAVDAIRLHQKIQATRPPSYECEVPISCTYETDKFILEINGRIDGVLRSADLIVIDEIKTIHGDLDKIVSNEEPVHWGQAKTYACFFAHENGLREIDVQLTYYHVISQKTREIRKPFRLEGLESFVEQMVANYLNWMERVDEWTQARNRSIAELTFPFQNYRHGQQEMSETVSEAISEKRQALIQAPTGSGKTMAALFPAIKALGDGHMDKLFFLTARNTGKSAAEGAINRLRRNGLALKSLTITAKEKICFNPDKACNGEECAYARGYYDRLCEAMEQAISYDCFTAESISELCQQHQICPFAFTLELSNYVDCIICDYNYAFDPRVHLRRFFSDGKTRSVLLVDEAHNLIDRARDMYSAQLHKENVLLVRRSLGGQHRALYKMLSRLNSILLEIKKQCEVSNGRYVERDLNPDIKGWLGKFLFAGQRYLTQDSAIQVSDPFVEFYFNMAHMYSVAERYDESYGTLYEIVNSDIRVKLFCLSPATEVGNTLSKPISTLFMSATLTPMSYFTETLGCEMSAREIKLPPPFPPENLKVLLAHRISTRYRDRGRTGQDLARLLNTFVQSKTGNYILFFPSYAYLTMIHRHLVATKAKIRTIIQKPNFSENERAAFLRQFSGQQQESLVGLAVMGGIFAEGIDLVGEQLSGVAIIGVGLPGLSFERDLLRGFYDDSLGQGYDYAYRYPGMTRVLQAAGRVIRTETDKGVVLLVDDRFASQAYRALFPEYWRPQLVGDADALKRSLTEFWETDRPSPSNQTDLFTVAERY